MGERIADVQTLSAVCGQHYDQGCISCLAAKRVNDDRIARPAVSDEEARDMCERLRQSGDLLRTTAFIDAGLRCLKAADMLERRQERIERLEATLREVQKAIESELAYAARREKEEPDCKYREGIAEGVCDVANNVNGVILAALQRKEAYNEQN